MREENIFVLGATGNIGSHLVKGLIAAGVRTSIFVRNEDKAKTIFEKEFKSGHLHIVQGDYENVDVFTNTIPGHTRLFLLVAELESLPLIKGPWGKIAYDHGVKQIVDLSSYTVAFNKLGYISYSHTVGEEDLLNVVGSNSLVILRPGYFTTNTLNYDLHAIKGQSKIFGVAPSHFNVPFIDPRDIADVALNVFLDPIEKHGISVYLLVSDPMTHEEKAQVLSKVLGREITYVQDNYENFYNRLISFQVPHKRAYDLINLSLKNYRESSPQISILTKRPIRRFEDWVIENKEKFL